MTHYPVTASWYRGVRDVSSSFKGRLSRACDWRPLQRQDASYNAPSCDYCQAYKGRIDTYWRTTWGKGR